MLSLRLVDRCGPEESRATMDTMMRADDVVEILEFLQTEGIRICVDGGGGVERRRRPLRLLAVLRVGVIVLASDPESPRRRVTRRKRITADLVDELVIADLLDVTFIS